MESLDDMGTYVIGETSDPAGKVLARQRVRKARGISACRPGRATRGGTGRRIPGFLWGHRIASASTRDAGPDSNVHEVAAAACLPLRAAVSTGQRQDDHAVLPRFSPRRRRPRGARCRTGAREPSRSGLRSVLRSQQGPVRGLLLLDPPHRALQLLLLPGRGRGGGRRRAHGGAVVRALRPFLPARVRGQEAGHPLRRPPRLPADQHPVGRRSARVRAALPSP